jgi:Tfp pilus assembly protein PilZ
MVAESSTLSLTHLHPGASFGRNLPMSKDVPRRARAGAGVPADSILVKIRIPLIQRARLWSSSGREEDVFLQEEDVFMMDIGLKGVFIERKAPLPVGDEVRIRFGLPGNEIPVEARCRVAWCHVPEKALLSKSLPGGMGLEFIEVESRGDERVRAFVEGYLGGQPIARRFHRTPPGSEGE